MVASPSSSIEPSLLSPSSPHASKTGSGRRRKDAGNDVDEIEGWNKENCVNFSDLITMPEAEVVDFSLCSADRESVGRARGHGSVSPPWSCDACTFMNEGVGALLACVMCGYVRTYFLRISCNHYQYAAHYIAFIVFIVYCTLIAVMLGPTCQPANHSNANKRLQSKGRSPPSPPQAVLIENGHEYSSIRHSRERLLFLTTSNRFYNLVRMV